MNDALLQVRSGLNSSIQGNESELMLFLAASTVELDTSICQFDHMIGLFIIYNIFGGACSPVLPRQDMLAAANRWIFYFGI